MRIEPLALLSVPIPSPPVIETNAKHELTLHGYKDADERMGRPAGHLLVAVLVVAEVVIRNHPASGYYLLG